VHFDQDVVERVKLESRVAIDRFQQRLWEMTRHQLGPAADFDAAAMAFTLRHNPFPSEAIHPGPYRLGRHDTDANTYRIGHPLAQRLVLQAKERSTPVAEVVFGYTGAGKKITSVERLVGTSGWLCCALLRAQALEAEDHVLLAGLDDRGEPVDQEAMRRLFDLPGQVRGPVRIDALLRGRLQELARSLESSLRQRQGQRNGAWFDAEVEKLDRWAADRHASVVSELGDLDERMKGLKKEAREAGTLPKKLELQQKVRNLELKRHEVWKTAELAKAEIDRQKEELLDSIAERLQQKTETTELFTIRWTVS